MAILAGSLGWRKVTPSLTRQVAELIAATCLLLVLVVGGFTYLLFSANMVDTVRRREEDHMVTQSASVNAMFSSYLAILYEAAIDRSLLTACKEFNTAAPTRFATIQSQLYQLLRTYCAHNPHSLGLAVYSQNDQLVSYDRNLPSAVDSFWASQGADVLGELREKTRQDSVGLLFATPASYGDTSPPDFNVPRFHLAIPLKDLYGDMERVGTLILSIDQRPLAYLLNPTQANGKKLPVYGVISDSMGIVMVHPDASLIGKPLDSCADLRDRANIARAYDFRIAGARLINVIRTDVLLSELRRITFSMSFIILMIVGVYIAIVYSIFHKTQRTIADLLESINGVKSGDLSRRAEVHSADEIGAIARNFNDMVSRLEELEKMRRRDTEAVITAIHRQRDAEIATLESQINSHFLHNTLNVMSYAAIEGRNEDVAEMIKLLSSCLRYTFEKGVRVVPCAREAQWLSHYLNLQKRRYGDVFDYRISLDPRVQDWPLRKLVIQPFVENAVLHGFEGLRYGGWLGISFKPYGRDFLRVSIEDNGVGMPEDKVAEIRSIFAYQGADDDAGIGLANACLRIKNYYRGRARLFIRSFQALGTRVTLLLPKPAPSSEPH